MNAVHDQGLNKASFRSNSAPSKHQNLPLFLLLLFLFFILFLSLFLPAPASSKLARGAVADHSGQVYSRVRLAVTPKGKGISYEKVAASATQLDPSCA